MAQTPQPQADVDKILSTIREVESSNNYGAKARGSSASGAYQFIDDTWKRYTQKSGIGTEYASAKDAPPEVQDQVARFKVQDILQQTGGDVNKVPLVWYTGNPEGRMTEAALKANQGLTPDKYQQKWLSVFNQGKTQTAQTAAVPAPRTTVQAPVNKKPGVQVAAAINPTDLPSSYTAALALNYLADTDPEGVTMSKVNEMLAEMMDDGGGSSRPSGGKVLQQFAQAKSVDPFQFVLQPEEEPKKQSRVIPKMPKAFAQGGEVSNVQSEDEYRKQSMDMLYNLRGNVGPVTGQFVPAPDGVDVRASTQLGAIRPFVDLSPNEMAVSQVGASYGNVGPQGGYEVSVSKRSPMETPYGKIDMPVTAQGMYSSPVGKTGRLEVGAFYVPRQGQMPESAYGGQLRYTRQFANGGIASNEVPQVDAQGKVIREAPTPEPTFSVGERIVGAGETALSALSGLTAPASIIYDVARGVPRDQISPGNFMYTPRTPAGQEMAHDLGRFMQDYKLDAAMPQVQLQRPYPVAPAAKQGITALRRGAQELQLPLAVDTPPTGALMPKPRVDTSILLPKENKPFIGEVERIVADLPGPVTKQQFLNFMKKQGRAYEIGRVERALENFGDNDKIQPTELMDRLKYTSPSRFTTEIIPPGSKYIYDTMDNPFPSTKPGAVNLLLDLPESDQALATLKERADTVLNNMSPYKFLSATNRSRVYTDGEANLGTRPAEYVKEMTPIIRELAEATGKDPEKSLERLTRLGDRAEFLTTLGTSRARIAFPALTSDWKKYTTMPEKDLPANLKSDFGTLDINKLLVKLYEDGADNLIKLANEAPEGFKVDTREVQILKRYIDLYRQGKASLNEVQEYAKFADMDIGAQHTTEIKALGSLLDRVATDVQRMAEEVPVTFYEGTHRAITAKNPISFSRFVEFTPQQEVELGISAPSQTRGAIMFLELQSDRQKALRLNKEVEEAFPGMGNLPQVTQQLMIKNAIYGGIKMNKGLVLFPGSDSAQAQLYEKLGPNLKQVVKDLGPGFKAQEFKFPNEKGEMATRWGVYIDEDAAKRIQTQGIRFAKGGMVDKPLYDWAA